MAYKSRRRQRVSTKLSVVAWTFLNPFLCVHSLTPRNLFLSEPKVALVLRGLPPDPCDPILIAEFVAAAAHTCIGDCQE